MHQCHIGERETAFCITPLYPSFTFQTLASLWKAPSLFEMPITTCCSFILDTHTSSTLMWGSWVPSTRWWDSPVFVWRTTEVAAKTSDSGLHHTIPFLGIWRNKQFDCYFEEGISSTALLCVILQTNNCVRATGTFIIRVARTPLPLCFFPVPAAACPVQVQLCFSPERWGTDKIGGCLCPLLLGLDPEFKLPSTTACNKLLSSGYCHCMCVLWWKDCCGLAAHVAADMEGTCHGHLPHVSRTVGIFCWAGPPRN